ncbi:putative toxin-antitoxin system toxin component, PIN family [Cellulophaga sp. L1A9]|nr:PIN domain-containing protein [Cellulophaga sp. L1A9]
MIHSPRFTVVLDACVLYPAPIRDILLSLAAEGLFKAKWSDIIQDEWLRNLLKNRADLKKAQLNQTIKAMNQAFPDANVENFEDLIPSIKLKDKDDRHVVACAIRCNADLIVTFNIKDFPKKELSKYDIEIQNPDELISNLIDINPKLACKAFSKMVKRLKNPRKTIDEVLNTLENCGLKKSIEKLKNNCQPRTESKNKKILL